MSTDPEHDAQVRQRMRLPLEIVLRALRAGQHVTIGLYTYAFDENNDLVYIAIRASTGAKIPLRCDLTFNAFRAVCDELSNEALFVLGAQTALTQMHDEEAHR